MLTKFEVGQRNTSSDTTGFDFYTKRNDVKGRYFEMSSFALAAFFLFAAPL